MDLLGLLLIALLWLGALFVVSVVVVEVLYQRDRKRPSGRDSDHHPPW